MEILLYSWTLSGSTSILASLEDSPAPPSPPPTGKPADICKPGKDGIPSRRNYHSTLHPTSPPSPLHNSTLSATSASMESSRRSTCWFLAHGKVGWVSSLSARSPTKPTQEWSASWQCRAGFHKVMCTSTRRQRVSSKVFCERSRRRTTFIPRWSKLTYRSSRWTLISMWRLSRRNCIWRVWKYRKSITSRYWRRWMEINSTTLISTALTTSNSPISPLTNIEPMPLFGAVQHWWG